MSESIVVLRDVKKHYHVKGRTVPVKALRGVTMEIPDGSMVAIKGPSGSGKTTLLQIIGALDVPTDGSAVVDSIELSDMSETELTEYRATTIGFVFQTFNLLPNLTALENAITGGAADRNVDWYSDAGYSVAVPDPTNVTVSDGAIFYPRVTDDITSCTNDATVTYAVNPLPVANNLTPALSEHAFGGGSAAGVDLTALENSITGGAADRTVSWYSDAGYSVAVPNPANDLIVPQRLKR